uniref:G_PROTEIN_RECEP_F1_2 domain-containing protein n=1 Tax=Steinernema glaseri TaxID=37863 RepID=A0A1I8ALI2_9BILA
MWSGVKIIQYFFIILLSFVNTALVVHFMLKSSSTNGWKTRSSLLLFLFSIIIVSCCYVQFSVIWLLYTFDLLNDLSYVNILFMLSGNITTSVRIFYDTTTIILLCHRICSIKWPVRHMDFGLFTISLISLAVTSASCSALLYNGFVVLGSKCISTSKAVNESGLCDTGTTVYNSLFFGMRLAFSVLVVIVGVVFHLVYRQYNRQLVTVHNSKVNRFVMCIFYLKVILEVVPFACDNILRSTIGVSVATYIGAYGALGGVLDPFLCCCAYLIPFMQKSKKTTPQMQITIIRG